jgi:NADH-quinone oxidoreductase subunit N
MNNRWSEPLTIVWDYWYQSFQAFREAWDIDALSWLTTESYLLLFVCILWVTIGLIKTVNLKGVEIVVVNGFAKYAVLFILLGAMALTVYRGYYQLNNQFYLLQDMLVLDNWVNWAQLGILLLTIVFVGMTSIYHYTRNSYYYELMLFTLTVVMLMLWLVMTFNFIVFYLVLEGISLVFYTIATRTFVYGGVEAGLKYYSLGALASILLLVGILCVFTAVGSTDFLVVALATKYLDVNSSKAVMLLVGLLLVMLAVFFKLSAFPGHVWTPDVYEGTTLEVLWIFAVLAKFTFFVVFLRFFVLFYLSPVMITSTSFWLTTSCLGSLLIGAAGAFLATTIKRFVAYTAINQMGFLFIGLSALTLDGIKSTITYLYIYMLANVLLFCVLTSLQSKKFLTGDTSLRSLKDVALLKNAPVEAGLLSISLLSLGGLPPAAGFVGKYLLWASIMTQYVNTHSIGVAENLLYILIISVVLSLLSTFYYLRMIKVSLFDNFEAAQSLTFDWRNFSDIFMMNVMMGSMGVLTVGWLLLVSSLDYVWVRLLLALTAPLSSSGFAV